ALRDEQFGNHVIPRRLAATIRVSGRYSVVVLVLSKADRDDCLLCLDSRHPTPLAHRSTPELRVEIHAPHGSCERLRRRPLALLRHVEPPRRLRPALAHLRRPLDP